jgi:hypothetical protein
VSILDKLFIHLRKTYEIHMGEWLAATPGQKLRVHSLLILLEEPYTHFSICENKEEEIAKPSLCS